MAITAEDIQRTIAGADGEITDSVKEIAENLFKQFSADVAGLKNTNAELKSEKVAIQEKWKADQEKFAEAEKSFQSQIASYQEQLKNQDPEQSKKFFDNQLEIMRQGYEAQLAEKTVDDPPKIAGRYTETYEEWFERQPDSVKYKILGPTRYNFYKSGITSIKSFSSGGKKLTLEELFEDIKIDTSKKVANALFPTEKWIKYSNGIYIAESRNRLLKNEMKKLSKEIAQAEILANNGFTVYLAPELGKGKHFDAIVNGVKTEFKTVTGKINKIGDNFLFALRQGDNVFIRYDRNTTKAAYKSLVGKAKVLLENGLKKMPTGTVYYWNNENEVLHKWSMKDIFEIAKKLL